MTETKFWCGDCGTLINEGEAKTFGICDDCWAKHHQKMKDNGAHSFTESAEVPKEGSEPVKLTEVGGSEKIPKESIIKFLYGSSSYKGYWYGDIPLWWRNLLREEIDSMLKEERNKAIHEAIILVGKYQYDTQVSLINELKALKSDSK